VIKMTNEMEQFIKKLALLCNEYQAGFGYSTNDDGVLVTIGDESISIGWPNNGSDILKKVFSVNV